MSALSLADRFANDLQQLAAIETGPSYIPYGAARRMFEDDQSSEILLSGPAGTGKTRANLERGYQWAFKYPGSIGLLVRKTRTSLTQSGIRTMNDFVLRPGDGVVWRVSSSEFQYPNGSILVIGGLDDASRIMSTDYDYAIVIEATELTVNDWESLTTRVRLETMPYNPILADCNPSGPRHWLKQKIDAGTITDYPSSHQDNPRYWDHSVHEWTPQGERYMERLSNLSGVRRLRLYKGLWAAAEGMIYDEWNPEAHMIDWFQPPDDWPRYWGVDFGYTNPFSFQAWAEDPDGRLYLFREIYRTRTLVEDHAAEIRRIMVDDPIPMAIIVDHDAEDRATLERHLGLYTSPAYKRVLPGIQAVQSRLRVAGDGKPRIFIMRDALLNPDRELVDGSAPYKTSDEIDSYVWDQSASAATRERPKKENDHGMDNMRYVVAFVDDLAVELADDVEDEYMVYEQRVQLGPDI